MHLFSVEIGIILHIKRFVFKLNVGSWTITKIIVYVDIYIIYQNILEKILFLQIPNSICNCARYRCFKRDTGSKIVRHTTFFRNVKPSYNLLVVFNSSIKKNLQIIKFCKLAPIADKIAILKHVYLQKLVKQFCQYRPLKLQFRFRLRNILDPPTLNYLRCSKT